MSLTYAQRSVINRANAQNSTGPKTEAGKAASSMNSLTHGLCCAEVLALPNEDINKILAVSGSWNGHYQPQSPAAQHLVDRCVHATVLSDRVDRHENALLCQQVRDAEEQWDRDLQATFDAGKALLATDPRTADTRAAVPTLMKTADGCRYLLGRWDDFAALLERAGSWTEDQADEMVQLTGRDPFNLSESDEAWEMILHAHAAARPGEDGTGARGWVFDPDSCRPDGFAGVPVPDPDSARAWLRALIAAHRATLSECEAELREYETAARAEAGDCAVILQDGPSARLFLRYQAEARICFHRAFTELVKTLARDKAEAEEKAPKAVPRSEPKVGASFEPGETMVYAQYFKRGPDKHLKWVREEKLWSAPEEAPVFEGETGPNPPPDAPLA